MGAKKVKTLTLVDLISNPLYRRGSDGQSILNMGAGKTDLVKIVNKLNKNFDFMINLDCGYKTPNTMEFVEQSFDDYSDGNVDEYTSLIDCNEDIFDFLGEWKYKFDIIIANRIFEHFFYDSGQVGQALSMCHSILKDRGKLLIIVPNHKRIAGMFRQENIPAPSEVLLLNTEFCNTQCDPHGSVWSPVLAKYYIEQENIFEITNITPRIMWENREYMYIELRK